MDSASPYPIPLPMVLPSHSRTPSASSSLRSSPSLYYQPPFDASSSTSQPMPQNFSAQPFDAHASTTSLQISTGTTIPHTHEAGEETAHPLRPAAQSSLHAPEASAEHQADPSQTSIADAMTNGAGPHGGLTRSLTHQERELISHLDRLKFFLATAPSRWSADGPSPVDPASLPVGHPSSVHPALNRFLLPNSEYVSCVLWGGLYHITGTDIVRALVFRFEAFGRPVRNMKKFEEGVFSDLRNLKPGSPFLDLLFKYQCIRTQKKQKVFYWFSVPHDRLFLDALERDLKREKMGLEPTTAVVGEPALSFTYDPKRSLYEQFSRSQGSTDGDGDLDTSVRASDDTANSDSDADNTASSSQKTSDSETASDADERARSKRLSLKKAPSVLNGPNSPFFSMFSLFEGSPTYKQRRKKVHKNSRRSPGDGAFGHAGYGSSVLPLSGPETYVDEYGRVQTVRSSPEGHFDRFGRDTGRMSAADMFVAQARGEFGGAANPDLIASQKERQRRAMEIALGQHVRVPHHHPNGLAGPGYAGRMSAQAHYNLPLNLLPSVLLPGSNMLNASPPGGVFQQSLQGQQLPEHHIRPQLQSRHTLPHVNFQTVPRIRSHTTSQGLGFNGSEAWSGISEQAPVRSKAFVCPLFSCGRMFKRTEHLKRHLRTHTLERPYQCQQCQKRFSRSDNLAQHYRTHVRAGAGGAEDSLGAVSVDAGGDVSDGQLETEEDALALAGVDDVQMYEVEVEGPVHEVSGDEEGLVMATTVGPAVPVSLGGLDGVEDGQDAYFQGDGVGPIVNSSPEQTPFVRPDSSLSYSNAATNGIPIPMRMSPPYHDYTTSLSAPSHKGSFDQPSMYPPELDVGGTGPIRRHRSVTPSVSRFGDSIRRPFSTAVSEHGAPTRSYHPYAVPGHHHSAESSPLAYNIPLSYSPANSIGSSSSRSHSRSSSSSQLQDQMQQMLSLDQLAAEQQAQAFLRDQMGHHGQGQGQGYPESQMGYSTATAAAAGSYELMSSANSGGAGSQVPGYEMYSQVGDATVYDSHAHGSGFSALAHHQIPL
ncbi:uncharacterized protein FIBRA_08183 [Fibroporia radiculosa]|uniref:C2H2-type domain-containing protein n=1 Tax=Fibroporia radiculosa TaxID=599839 RepID=J4H514_9APHY|nr:uncharacterized protein FIBRA_08183 [Fibroporia radiculosa]CCM05944.1 predicted protein [Fibroporia radiculosa]